MPQQDYMRIIHQSRNCSNFHSILHSIPATNGLNMISCQCMDSLQLLDDVFVGYPYAYDEDRFSSLNKILKCMMRSHYSLSNQSQYNGDTMNFIFELSDSNRYSNFELKSIDIC